MEMPISAFLVFLFDCILMRIICRRSSDFLSNLLVLLLRVLNSGISDSGLLTHLSEATAGSLNGVGHSTAYEELATYSYVLCFFCFDYRLIGVVAVWRSTIVSSQMMVQKSTRSLLSIHSTLRMNKMITRCALSVCLHITGLLRSYSSYRSLGRYEM